jgi:hypothetical protein
MKIYIGDDAKEKLLETLTADVEVCCVLFPVICLSIPVSVLDISAVHTNWLLLMKLGTNMPLEISLS